MDVQDVMSGKRSYPYIPQWLEGKEDGSICARQSAHIASCSSLGKVYLSFQSRHTSR